MKRLNTLLIFVLTCLTGMYSQEPAPAFRVDVRGTGEPVLFLPGFSCPGEVWEETVRELENRFECHVVSYAGFGGMEPVGFPWLPQLREGIEAYLVERGLSTARLVGHSMGGTLALWLGTSEKLDPRAIVVVDGLPAMGALMFPNYDSSTIQYESPRNQQMLDMDANSFAAMAGGMATGMVRDSIRQQQIAAWILEADRETYVYGYTDLLKLDLRGELPRITAPVHILAATRPYGEAVARQNYTDQYTGLRDYTLEFAPDAAHFVMYDQPEWFVSNLGAILD